MEHMLAYEFYYHNNETTPQLIGILPERRKDLQRITSESVMNWVKTFLGDEEDMRRISFVEVSINPKTGEISEAQQIVTDLKKKR